MTEEESKNIENTEVKEESKLSVLEETKQVIAELKKEKEDLTKLRDELSQLRSDQLLSGTSGGEVKAVTKEETPQEYNARINKEISEGKHNE